MVDNHEATENAQPDGHVAGLLAQFESPQTLVTAAAKVRAEGFRRWDAHSPFPIHGLERAMGIRMTILPWLVMGAGLTGGVVAIVMQWWTNAVAYPLNISGKPLFSLPANIPVTFELIVLFSSLTAFIGALALSLLPQFWHSTFSSTAFSRVTTDGLFISVEAKDPKFDPTSTRDFLRSIGAVSVDACFDPSAGRQFPGFLRWVLGLVVLLSLVPPLVVATMRAKGSGSPRIHLFQDMDFQPKYKAQTASPLFPDGRSNRLPLAGTIPIGALDEDDHLVRGRVDGAWSATVPPSVPKTMDTMRRGQERFNIFCATCHGLAGDGNGPVAERGEELRLRGDALDWIRPTALANPQLVAKPVGEIFQAITNGKGKMPSYGSQISVPDRWAIVMYVRALQRSQTASLEDVPEEERSRLP